MSYEVGLVGSGPRVEMLGRLLLRAERRAVVWPGLQPGPALEEARGRLTALGLEVVDGPQEVARRARLAILAVTARELRPLARQLGDHLQGYHCVVHLTHGLEPESGLRCSEVLREETPTRKIGALVGPIDAVEMVDGKPGAAVVGSRFPEVIAAMQDAFSGPLFRVYGNSDLVGVELSGAAASLVAVAIGVADALDLGPSIRGTLTARGVAEMGRLAESAGAQARTASGMAGLGYLVALLSGQSRVAHQLGRALATGQNLEQARQSLGAGVDDLIDGARTIQEEAAMRGVSLHIIPQVAMMVTGASTAAEALQALLSLSQMME